MVVIRRTPNGLYRLAELDGLVSKLPFALSPTTRSRTSIPGTRLVKREELIKIHLDEDIEDSVPDPNNGADSDGSDN